MNNSKTLIEILLTYSCYKLRSMNEGIKQKYFRPLRNESGGMRIGW